MPLWQLAPTRGRSGQGMADFMMLIPGLADRSAVERVHAQNVVREICESYGEQVAFADINLSLNLLWVSVDARPGLAGRVAASIRQRLPDALLVGGQLGMVAALPAVQSGPVRFRHWLLALSRRIAGFSRTPRRVGRRREPALSDNARD